MLANDFDPDGDSLTALLVSAPPNGSVTLNPDGSFTYEPQPGFPGQDQFEYLAQAPGGGQQAAVVRLISRKARIKEITFLHEYDIYSAPFGIAVPQPHTGPL